MVRAIKRRRHRHWSPAKQDVDFMVRGEGLFSVLESYYGFLCDPKYAPEGFDITEAETMLRDSWESHKADFLPQYIEKMPHCRPFAFWMLDRPEAFRRQTAGELVDVTDINPWRCPNGEPDTPYNSDVEFETDVSYLERFDLITAEEHDNAARLKERLLDEAQGKMDAWYRSNSHQPGYTYGYTNEIIYYFKQCLDKHRRAVHDALSSPYPLGDIRVWESMCANNQ